jgi:predicted chitinase
VSWVARKIAGKRAQNNEIGGIRAFFTGSTGLRITGQNNYCGGLTDKGKLV